jgi:regulator of protease activity HflC (stomatin/prohibitin superfamily)
MEPRLNTKGLGALVTFLVAFLILSQGIYTVNSGTVGVLSTFGELSDEVQLPGIHFKIPMVQKVHIMDIKMQTANYQDRSDMTDRDGVLQRPSIIVLDSKNLSIGMEITVQFTPDASKGKEILSTYGINYFEKLINPIIRDVIRDVVSQYQAEDIAFKRSLISVELNRILMTKFENLPFILNDMQLRDIDLPQIVRKKIEEVQLAKQEEQRLAMIEKQAAKNQSIKTIEANTKLIEVTTQAKADAEKKRIEAEAKAFQIEKEATAVAQANLEIAKSLSADLIRYESIKRWNGEYPKMLLSGQDNSIIQLPKLEEVR